MSAVDALKNSFAKAVGLQEQRDGWTNPEWNQVLEAIDKLNDVNEIQGELEQNNVAETGLYQAIDEAYGEDIEDGEENVLFQVATRMAGAGNELINEFISIKAPADDDGASIRTGATQRPTQTQQTQTTGTTRPGTPPTQTEQPEKVAGTRESGRAANYAARELDDADRARRWFTSRSFAHHSWGFGRGFRAYYSWEALSRGNAYFGGWQGDFWASEQLSNYQDELNEALDAVEDAIDANPTRSQMNDARVVDKLHRVKNYYANLIVRDDLNFSWSLQIFQPGIYTEYLEHPYTIERIDELLAEIRQLP